MEGPATVGPEGPLIDKTPDWIVRVASEQKWERERRQSIAIRRWTWLVAIVSTGLCPASLLIALFDPAAGLFRLVVIGPILFTVFGIYEIFRRRQRFASLRDENRLALAQEYLAADGWLVDLSVYQGAALTGIDRGLVWIENERLFFSGHRTSFRLSGGDVMNGTVTAIAIEGLRPSLSINVMRLTSVGYVSLGFDVVEPSHSRSHAIERTERLAWAIRSWATKDLVKGGQSPPLTIGPGIPSSTNLLMGFVGSLLFWTALIGTIGALVSTAPFLIVFGFLAVWIAAGFCRDVWLPWRRWRAWKDRRRLDRSLRQNKEQ